MTASGDKRVAERFRAKGWQVLDKGWPDLLVYDYYARAMAIELKRGQDQLRPHQKTMKVIFESLFSIPFYVAREKDVEELLKISPYDDTIPRYIPEPTVEVLELENEILKNKIETLERDNRVLKMMSGIHD